MLTPTLREIRYRFPRVFLYLAVPVQYWDIFCTDPYISELVDPRFVESRHFDQVLDLTTCCVGPERCGGVPANRIDLFAQAVGLTRLRSCIPTWQVLPEEKAWAQGRVGCQAPAVVLHTAARDPKRTWPLERYIHLIEATREANLDIQYLVSDQGGSQDWEKLGCQDISRTTLRELAALTAEADLFVGPDSGPMHIAAAVRTESICLFGGQVPAASRINHYLTHQAIQHPVSCQFCWNRPCTENIRCMKAITVDEVLEQIRDRLQLN